MGAPLWVLPRGQSRSGQLPPCGTFSRERCCFFLFCSVWRTCVYLYNKYIYIQSRFQCENDNNKPILRGLQNMSTREFDRLALEREFDLICPTIRAAALYQWRRNPAARRNWYRITSGEDYAQEVITVCYFHFVRLAQRGISGKGLASSLAP